MYKLFDNPTEIMNERDVVNKYPKMGYVMLNPETIIKNGVDYGCRGILLGVADLEDYHDFLRKINEKYDTKYLYYASPYEPDFLPANIEESFDE